MGECAPNTTSDQNDQPWWIDEETGRPRFGFCDAAVVIESSSNGYAKRVVKPIGSASVQGSSPNQT